LKLLLRAKGALQLKKLTENIQRHEKVMYGQSSPSGGGGSDWWKFWQSGKR